MAILLLLIAAGFLFAKAGILPPAGIAVLSKLERYLFIPALVLGTFMSNMSPDRIRNAWQYLLCGLIVALLSVPPAVLLSRLLTKGPSIRPLFTYGLVFSNFGYMGNAVVSVVFPDIFMEYLVFCLPFWMLINLWGIPFLLVPSENREKTIGERLKPLLNPMFFAMAIGMIIGITGLPIPDFLVSGVSALGNCMSPVAMLLTGITIAGTHVKKILGSWSIYAASVIRLLILPLAAIGLLMLLPVPRSLELCIVSVLAMPLGLNVIVIPASYGKDTSLGAGMALVSHLLSCGTIPLIFLLFDRWCPA